MTDGTASFDSFVIGQYAGELCTYGPPNERKPTWIVKFEDASRGEAHFDNEREAILFFLRASNSWNCTLLTTAHIPVGDGGGSE